MGKGIYAICLMLVSLAVWAQPEVSELEYGVLFTSGLKTSFPQVFVVNRDGQVIHYHSGQAPGLKLSFVKNQPVAEQDKIKAGLFKLLSAVPDFTQVDYSLFFIRLHEKNDACEPCQSQHKINQNVLKSLTGNSVQEYEIKVYFADIPQDLTKDEIIKRFPYVQFR